MLGCPTNAPCSFVHESENLPIEVKPGHTIQAAIEEQENIVAQCLRNILVLQNLQRSTQGSWSAVNGSAQRAAEQTSSGFGSFTAASSFADQLQESINRLLLRLIAQLMDQFSAQSNPSDQPAEASEGNNRSFVGVPPTASNDDDAALPSGSGTQSPPAASNGASGDETAQLAQVVSVFGRHQDLIKDQGKIHHDDLVALANNESTPEDVRQACQQVLNNQNLWDRLDAGKTGRTDGHFSIKDVVKLQKNADIQAYTQAQSEQYAQNYIPSESTAEQVTPRPITDSDAERELYRFSESLPKHINLGMLEAIANGTAHIDKCPPQLRAAAQHFVSHPDAWKKFTQGEDKISRNKLCDLAAEQVTLRSDETDTLKTIQDNQALFFGQGKLTKDRLNQIALDETNSEAVRSAASTLEQDSTLFSMLDNAKTHAGGNGWHKSNDGKISQNDLQRFVNDQAPFATKPKSQEQAQSDDDGNAWQSSSSKDVQAQFDAQADMIYGREEEPDAKKSRGGDVKKGLMIAGEVLAAATVFVPGAGELVGVAGAARLGGFAAKELATAAASRGSVSLAKEVAKEGVKEGAQEAAQQGLNQVIADQAQKKAQKNAANAFYSAVPPSANPAVING